MKKLFYSALLITVAACTQKHNSMDNNKNDVQTVLNIDLVAGAPDTVHGERIAADKGASYDGMVVYIASENGAQLSKKLSQAAGPLIDPPYNIDPAFVPGWLPAQVKNAFFKNTDNSGTWNTHNHLYELGKLKKQPSDNGFIAAGGNYLLIVVHKN